MNKRQQRLEILLSTLSEMKIYLYGAGKRGRAAADNMINLGMYDNVKGFIDDQVNVMYSEHCGKPVLSIKDIDRFDKSNAAFIICTYAVKGMTDKLMKNKISSENIFFFPELLVDNVDLDIFKQNENSIRKVYQLLEDNLSKYIYKSIFDIYRTGNIGILSRTQGKRQYFPLQGEKDGIDGFLLSDRECFIDGGGYTGDSIDEFIIQVKDRFCQIYSFEPDEKNFEVLQKRYQCDSRIKVYPVGIYSQDTIIGFENGKGRSSGIREDGEKKVEVRAIDSIISEDVKVSLIKMDIEGCEQEALLGAKRIISECHPKLAICIYHKIEDLWNIPLLIYQMNPKYKMYIRNYADRLDEVVFYAVE